MYARYHHILTYTHTHARTHGGTKQDNSSSEPTWFNSRGGQQQHPAHTLSRTLKRGSRASCNARMANECTALAL